jgi:nitrate reductase NapAB chaperone NapD
MNISSVLVNAQPQVLHDVQRDLAALHGVEIHVATADGRLIVTIEADSAQAARP